MDLRYLTTEDLVTGKEAAAIAGVREPTIRQWATRGKLHRFPGRRRREGTMYARPEVEAEVARRQAAA